MRRAGTLWRTQPRLWPNEIPLHSKPTFAPHPARNDFNDRYDFFASPLQIRFDMHFHFGIRQTLRIV
jgi:hypothetical protein